MRGKREGPVRTLERLRKKTWVYFMRDIDSGEYKVGCSTFVAIRRLQLQSTEKRRLTVVAETMATPSTERLIKYHLWSHRIRGRLPNGRRFTKHEWFRPARAVKAMVRAVRAGETAIFDVCELPEKARHLYRQTARRAA